MATHDVPGANPANHDELHVGCWAEHPDGSLIFVDGVENKRVIYVIFDLDRMVEYRDAMDEKAFKRQFSYDPKAKTTKSVQWTWHDKTSFPWDRVMKDFAQGEHQTSALATMTAATKIAESLGLRASEIEMHPSQQKAARSIMQRLWDAGKEFGRKS